MFKNRHIQVKVVKDAKNETVNETPSITHEDIERMLHNGLKKVVIGTLVVGAVFKALDTASQIAVKKTKEPKND